jgi:hypothetical protein
LPGLIDANAQPMLTWATQIKSGVTILQFQVDQGLIVCAQDRIAGRDDLFWLIGGSCTGKSTLSKALEASTGIQRYDLDARIYGDFIPRYHPDRHPASTRYFSNANPFAWALSLAPADLDHLNRAANAEYLDLLAEDLDRSDLQGPLLIDGGITHPSVLVQVVPAGQVCCLEIDESQRLTCWEESPERGEMRTWIRELPAPEEKWVHFLSLDRMISDTIVTESRKAGITVILRRPADTVETLSAILADWFDL